MARVPGVKVLRSVPAKFTWAVVAVLIASGLLLVVFSVAESTVTGEGWSSLLSSLSVLAAAIAGSSIAVLFIEQLAMDNLVERTNQRLTPVERNLEELSVASTKLSRSPQATESPADAEGPSLPDDFKKHS